jgi:hypothetical protein
MIPSPEPAPRELGRDAVRLAVVVVTGAAAEAIVYASYLVKGLLPFLVLGMLLFVVVMGIGMFPELSGALVRTLLTRLARDGEVDVPPTTTDLGPVLATAYWAVCTAWYLLALARRFLFPGRMCVRYRTQLAILTLALTAGWGFVWWSAQRLATPESPTLETGFVVLVYAATLAVAVVAVGMAKVADVLSGIGVRWLDQLRDRYGAGT